MGIGAQIWQPIGRQHYLYYYIELEGQCPHYKPFDSNSPDVCIKSYIVEPWPLLLSVGQAKSEAKMVVHV